jgi:hypothetical protein
MEGTTFGNVPLHCEVKLEVWDSPNSAGVVIDAVRCAKLALDRGMSGALTAPSSYFMKSPPLQYTDYEAQELTEAFIRGRAPRSIKPRRSSKSSEPNIPIATPQEFVTKSDAAAKNSKQPGTPARRAPRSGGRANKKPNFVAEDSRRKSRSPVIIEASKN